MFCETYKQPLMDAAVFGGKLPRELELHLHECAGCAAGFTAELSLLASMDAQLRRSVNGEVPASMVARVRGAVAEQVDPERRIWRNWILAPVGAVVMAAVALLLIPRHGSGSLEKGIEPVAIARLAEPLTIDKNMRTAARGEAVSPVIKRAKRREVAATVAAVAEVKVQPSAERAMLQLIRITREQPEAIGPMIADGKGKSLAIQPIDVAELNWAPLLDEGGAKN